MGAMDPQYCVLLNLAIHLETEGMSNGSSLENDWVFPLGTDNPWNAKNKAYRILRDEVWSGSEFNKLGIIGLIGTHSLRKYPSTHARRNGCSRDDIDFRGRWK